MYLRDFFFFGILIFITVGVLSFGFSTFSFFALFLGGFSGTFLFGAEVCSVLFFRGIFREGLQFASISQ